MFYFTCNESIIYENSLFEISLKKERFHDIQFFLDAPIYEELFSKTL